MTARKVHFDRDGFNDILCGATPRKGADELQTHIASGFVTCANCLAILADIEAERAADVSHAAEQVVAEAEAFLDSLDTQAIEAEVVALSLSMVPASGKWERDVAARHGLEEADVSNAVAAGWLKR